MCGFIAQLVEHRTGIPEVMGSNPVEAMNFSGFFFPIAKLKIYCDDHSSLSIFIKSTYEIMKPVFLKGHKKALLTNPTAIHKFSTTT